MRSVPAGTIAVLAAALIGGCGQPQTDKTVVAFWTTDHEQDRIETQRALAADFMAVHTQIEVRVVGVPENDLPKRLAAHQAAGTLPDVVRMGLEYVSGYADEGLLDTQAATETIERLGRDTFADGPLQLLRHSGGGYKAVPVDGWAQCLWYRRDWFEEAGLPPPTTWERIRAAAEHFHRPVEKSYGIVIGTDPQQVYTQQTFEHFALSAGLRLFAPDGSLDLPGDRLAETLTFYRELAAFGPPGNNNWREARKYYLSGRAAMMFYSPYIVDDIAGFVEDAQPVEDLARHTDFVSLIAHSDGVKAAYGQVVSLAVMTGKDPQRREAAKTWVSFLLGEGYLTLCNMSPGGKVPVRHTIVDDWEEHAYFEYYPPGLARRLASAMDGIGRWGWRDGRQFPAITDVYARKIFPALIGDVMDGRLDPAAARARVAGDLDW